MLDGERTVERERIGGAGVVVVGRDNRHAAETAHGLRERLNAGRAVAVIVGDKNVHGNPADFGELDRLILAHRASKGAPERAPIAGCRVRSTDSGPRRSSPRGT